MRAAAGDRLLLVTDGVLEAPAPDGAEFGDAGVERRARRVSSKRATPARARDARSCEALRAHTGIDPMEHDDVSFYVAEIVPPPPGPQVWQI